MKTRVTIEYNYSQLPDDLQGKRFLVARDTVFENGWVYPRMDFTKQINLIVGDSPDQGNIRATLSNFTLNFSNQGRLILISGQETIDHIHGFAIPVTWRMEYLGE